MPDNRTTARIVGACFILSNVVFILGAAVFLEPVLAASDALSAAASSQTTVVIGALLELVNAFAYLGVAVFMFPLLKIRFESLALGYLGLRIIEFVMQILADISPLALLTLSEAAGPSVGQAVALLQAQRFWAFQMVSLTFGASALLFYAILHQLRLVPRLLSIWGLLGGAIVLANLLLDMLGIVVPNLGVVMLANELFLGGWLIVRGFNQRAPLPATA